MSRRPSWPLQNDWSDGRRRAHRGPVSRCETFGADGAIALSAGDVVSVPVEQRPFREPAVAIVLDVAAAERDDEVLQSIGHALGHLADPRGIDQLGRLCRHAHAMVRWAAAGALHRFAERDHVALGLLVDLTTDAEPLVRDWACFGLYLSGRDTPELRAALAARCADDDLDTRAEALRGLANLGDPGAVEPLLNLLVEAGPGGPLDVLEDAARYLLAHTGDPRLRAYVTD